MPIASSCKTSESQAFMLFMLLMSIASGSNRIDLPDVVKRISGLFAALYMVDKQVDQLRLKLALLQ